MIIKKDSSHSFDVSLAIEIGVEKAILIGSFQFWISENEKRKSAVHFHKGEYWTYDSAKGLAEKYPYFNDKSIARWTGELIKAGWLKKDNFNKNSLDKTNWYGRGKLMIDWFLTPIPQNKESTPQNDTPTPQNEETIDQNEGSVPHFEECNIEDTVINSFQTSVINHQQQPASTAAVVDAEKKDEVDSSDSKKNEGTGPAPNPLPTEQEVREELAESETLWKHAFERKKLVKRHEEYLDLIEEFIGQQNLKAEPGKPVFEELHKVRWHFLHWLNKKDEVKPQANGNNQPGQTNKRTAGSLRPTAIGQPNYGGAGSDCKLEL